MKIDHAMGNGGRSCPTVNDYETIDLMRKKGAWDKLSIHEQAQARAYLEGPLGRLICSLHDAQKAAREYSDAVTEDKIRTLHMAAKCRLLSIRFGD